VAQNVETLIVANAIYGMGETVQVSFGVSLGELVPNKHRPMIMSLIFLSCAPFATFGPIMARQMIAHGLSWRWTYYLGDIVIASGTILLFFFYHPPTFDMLHEKKSKISQLKELDYVGISLWISGLTLFLLGVSWGGNVGNTSINFFYYTPLLGYVYMMFVMIFRILANIRSNGLCSHSVNLDVPMEFCRSYSLTCYWRFSTYRIRLLGSLCHPQVSSHAYVIFQKSRFHQFGRLRGSGVYGLLFCYSPLVSSYRVLRYFAKSANMGRLTLLFQATTSVQHVYIIDYLRWMALLHRFCRNVSWTRCWRHFH
jgi:hypothetical protein